MKYHVSEALQSTLPFTLIAFVDESEDSKWVFFYRCFCRYLKKQNLYVSLLSCTPWCPSTLRWRNLKTEVSLPGVTPIYGLYRYVRPQRVGFYSCLVKNRVSILAILVLNRVWFWHSSLELGMFLRRSYFFIVINRTVNKSPSQLMFRATVPATAVINRVSSFLARS